MPKQILLTTVGSAGDVFPMIGLGIGLKARGHNVTVICVPIFEEDVRTAGLNFIPMGTMADIQAALDEPDLWHPVKGFEVIARLAILKYMQPLYEILEAYDPGETLVVASSLAFGARIAQEKRSMPLITAHLQSSILLSADNPAEMGGVMPPKWLPVGVRRVYLRMIESAVIDRLLAPGLNAFRATLGLPAVKGVFSRWMNSTQAVLGLFPDWFSPKQPDWPSNIILTGFIKHESGTQELPSEVAAFLDAGDAPLVFTAGSANVHVEDYFRTAAAVVEILGERAIFLSRFPDQLPNPLPESILHAEWVPMSKVLPRARLLVHHGGIGTLAQATAAGIPQLVTPLAHDQFDNANRIEELGVGKRLDPKRFKEQRAVKVIGAMLRDDLMKEKAAGFASMMDFEEALERTCAEIESFC